MSQLYECQQERWASHDKSVQITKFAHSDEILVPVKYCTSTSNETVGTEVPSICSAAPNVTLSLLKSEWEVFHEILQLQLHGRHSKSTLRIFTFHF